MRVLWLVTAFGGNIIETGTDSYRLADTREQPANP